MQDLSDEAPPRQCYLCQGEQEITVSVWHGKDEVLESRTCVRCWGSGELTEGKNLDQLFALNASAPIRPSPPCICDFKRDGPEGHPRCPAR